MLPICGLLIVLVSAPGHPRVFITTARAHRTLAAYYEQITGRPHSRMTGEQRRGARGLGQLHVAHELDVTWFDLALHDLAEHRADLTLEKTERRYQEPPHPGGQQLMPVPDAGYYLTHHREGRRWFEWCLLEFDRGTMAPDKIAEKLDTYRRWTDSAIGHRTLAALHRRFGDTATREPTYRLLFVVRARPGEGTNLHRLALIMAEAVKLPWAMRRRIWLTTAADFETHDRDLAAPIWLLARQAGRWLPGYRRLLDHLPEGHRPRHGRAFITGQITSQPRLSLFPPTTTPAGIKPPVAAKTS